MMKKLFTPALLALVLGLVVTGCLNSHRGSGGEGECEGDGEVTITIDGDTHTLPIAVGAGSAVTADGTVTVNASPQGGQFPRVVITINYSQAGTYDMGATKPGSPLEIQGQVTVITGTGQNDTYTTGITLPLSGTVTLDTVDFQCGGEVTGTFDCQGINTNQDALDFDGSFSFVLNTFVEAD